MRLIDADTAKLDVKDFAVTSNPAMNRFNKLFVDLHNKEIDNAPTIDAVPVVRCKDCKMRNSNGICEYHFAETLDNWFCWAGEKKEAQ